MSRTGLGLDDQESSDPMNDENEDESYDEYQIESEDSDDEQDEVDPEIEVALPISKIVTIEDLEELKSKTVDLLDPSWKTSRNEHLIRKMLQLEEPTITGQVSRCNRFYMHSCIPHLFMIVRIYLFV